MLFNNKNVGATYQLHVHNVLKTSSTMEVYVDDIVVKSTRVKNHPANLERVFSKFRAHNMCLNPKKCFFREDRGKNSRVHDNPKRS